LCRTLAGSIPFIGDMVSNLLTDGVCTEGVMDSSKSSAVFDLPFVLAIVAQLSFTALLVITLFVKPSAPKAVIYAALTSQLALINQRYSRNTVTFLVTAQMLVAFAAYLLA
jgi:hypothetical protein